MSQELGPKARRDVENALRSGQRRVRRNSIGEFLLLTFAGAIGGSIIGGFIGFPVSAVFFHGSDEVQYGITYAFAALGGVGGATFHFASKRR